MELTLEEKQELQALVEGGAQVATVVYNPNTATEDPEATAIADGWEEWARSDTQDLVEVIYTR